MIEFVVVRHAVRDVDIVEVWRAGVFLATISPARDDGTLRVITKHTVETSFEPVGADRLTVLRVAIIAPES